MGHENKKTRKTLEQRLLEKCVCDLQTRCWVWLGGKDRKGYGCIYTKERGGAEAAHRVSYRLYLGAIATGLAVCHRCDNPGCVNPQHLELGTPRENMEQKITRGRAGGTGWGFRAPIPQTRSVIVALTDEERFREGYVVRQDGCWEWVRSRNEDGYGQITFRGESTRAHRAAYEIHKGAVPQGRVVRHTCDNRACVNPDHLLLGSQQDNIQDMVRRGRRASFDGEKNGRAKLTLHEVELVERFLLRHPPKLGRNSGSCNFLGRWFGVTPTMIGRIGMGKAWGANTQCETALADVRPKQNHRLTERDVQAIKWFLLRHPPRMGIEGGQCGFLSRWFRVSQSMISSIHAGRSWREVDAARSTTTSPLAAKKGVTAKRSAAYTPARRIRIGRKRAPPARLARFVAGHAGCGSRRRWR
jgi:hypothetical protein